MMNRHGRRLSTFLAFLLGGVLALAVAAPVSALSVQKKNGKGGKGGKAEKGEKGGKGGKKNRAKGPLTAPTGKGTPMLWDDPGDVATLNLFWGIGSQEEQPKPPFTFDKEDATGTNPKVKIVDANGVKWNIKFDEEVHAEIAASRIVWACGYLVEESYYVASGKINNVGKLDRARKFVAADGSFRDGMFEKRPDDVSRRAINWAWESNPFRGTKELSGLVMLNALLNNWDAKETNNNVLGMFGEDGKTVQDWYLVADWGGSFGKMGGFMSHTKWDLDDFNKQAFLDGVSGGQVRLNYSGKMGSSMRAVPLDHARWFAGIVGKLSDAQLRDAFRAAGAMPFEIDGFTRRLRQKITELKAAVGS
jgi:hypothetical protein